MIARLRRAFRQLRSLWVLLQALLVATTVAFTALWLQISDRTAGERTLSITMLILATLALPLAQTYVLILVRRRGGERAVVWKGALLLLGLALLYVVVATIFDVGEMRDVTRASWWSLQPRVSTLIGVDTLLLLQASLWSTLRCLLLATLLPFAMEGVSTGLQGRWVRRAAWVLLEPLYWLVVLGCALAGTLVTQAMLNLRPHLPVLLEILLTISKVITIFAVDVAALCYAFSLTGTYLRDAQTIMPGVPAGLPSSAPRRKRKRSGVL